MAAIVVTGLLAVWAANAVVAQRLARSAILQLREFLELGPDVVLAYGSATLEWLPPALVLEDFALSGEGSAGGLRAQVPRLILEPRLGRLAAGDLEIAAARGEAATLSLFVGAPSRSLEVEALAFVVVSEAAPEDESGGLRLEAQASVAGGVVALVVRPPGEQGPRAELSFESLTLARIGPILALEGGLEGSASGAVEMEGPLLSPQRLHASIGLRDVELRMGEVRVRGLLELEAELAGSLLAPDGPRGTFDAVATGAELEYGDAWSKPAGIEAHLSGRVLPAMGGGFEVDDVRMQVGTPKMDETPEEKGGHERGGG